MKTTIIIAIAIMSLLIVSACTPKELPKENTNTNTQQQANTAEPEADTTQYIDSQIVDPSQDIEIGSMV